jgi:hypothetical protein
VEVGPDALPAAPTGAGGFTRSFYGTEQQGWHTFNYSQGVAGSGYAGTITLTLSFEVVNGVYKAKSVSLDELGWTQSGFSMGGQLTGPGGGDLYLSFISCAMTHYNCVVHEFQMEGGDRLTFEHCLWCPLDWICKSTPCGLRRAQLQSGAEVRDTSDPFKLAASMRHHDWGSDFVIKLVPPLGDEYGVYLGSLNYPDQDTFTTLIYLDTKLAALRSKAITGHTTRASW